MFWKNESYMAESLQNKKGVEIWLRSVVGATMMP